MKSIHRGQQTERACCRYLQQQGLKFITSNYRTRNGEIDLIMQQHKTLVFIEVRYRKHQQYGSAIESVNFHKQQKLLHTVTHYCQHHNISQPIRIDVVGVSMQNKQYQFEWIKNAIEG